MQPAALVDRWIMQNPELQSAEILGKKGENCEKPNHNNCRNSEVPLQPLLLLEEVGLRGYTVLYSNWFKNNLRWDSTNPTLFNMELCKHVISTFY